MNNSREFLVHPTIERGATDTERHFVGLQDALDSQIENPPQGDEYIRAYAIAVRAALTHDNPISEFIHETMRRRPQFEGSYLINKLRSALQNQLYVPSEHGAHVEPARHRILLHNDNKPLRYPQDFTEPEIWMRAFEEVLADPDAFREFVVHAWGFSLASNVSERYKGVKLFGNVAIELGRLDEITMADIGCSQQAGGNHLMSGMSFERVSVWPHGNAASFPAPGLTRAVNSYMDRPTPFRHITGIDVFDPVETRSWARACSHYPSELLDTKRVERYDKYTLDTQKNVHFYRSNFAEFEYKKFKLEQEREDKPSTFKIVNFTTMLYQATPEERDRMLQYAALMAEEFIVVQDFVGIDPNDPAKLIFRENWQDDPFPYRTLVMDMREDPPRWHEAFRWRDGRCREMTVGMGRIALQGGGKAALWTPLYTQGYAMQKG